MGRGRMEAPAQFFKKRGVPCLTRLDSTKQFLSALFGDKPSALHVLVWTLQNRRSQWFTDLDAAAEYAQRQASDKDVYVGVGMAPDEVASHPDAWKQRCPTAKVAGIVGLWADVDVLDPVHSKTNLPPTIEDALALIDSLGLSPSLVIDSGHGVQAYWQFKEPWVFENDEERQQAYSLSARWTATMRVRAAERGWDVDSTYDLARVLRMAGTTNRKAEPKPVKVIACDPTVRYDPSVFDGYVPEVAATRATQTLSTAGRVMPLRGEAGALMLAPDASPPFEKFEALREIEAKVKQSWDRTRRDMQDQSASSYDLSLATFAAQASWSDQEIANLIIASRRKHGDDLKLRQDYYARTIAKARDALTHIEADESLQDALHAPEHTLPPEDKRKAILGALSALFGVSITRIVKYLADPPQYRLETSAGNIMLGGIEAITNQVSFINKFAAATNVIIAKVKGPKWDDRAQAILNACDEESLGDEATDEGMSHSWLNGYLAERKPLDSLEEAVERDWPFRRDSDVFIFGAGLRKWLSLNQGEKITAKQMGAILRAGGCSAETVGAKIDNRKTTKGVWKLPPHYD